MSWVREIALDPLEQAYTLEIRVQKHRAGSLQGEELRTLTGTLYFRNELVAMLGEVGFSGTRVLAGYQNRTASAEDEELVYLAFKQA